MNHERQDEANCSKSSQEHWTFTQLCSSILDNRGEYLDAGHTQSRSLQLREDGIVLFVERSDYSDQTIAEFGLRLDILADELPGHRVFLLIDLSQVSKMPSPNQEKALQRLLVEPRVVHFAMFGARRMLRVVATFLGVIVGNRGTLWETQEDALQHLYRIRSAADQSSQGAHSSSTSPGKT